MNIIRDRSQLDDRHLIRNPFGANAHDMSVFANTLMKTRIPDLFKTAAGLRGHAQQIQQELNRLSKIEGRCGEEVERAICVSKALRNALIKSKNAAVKNGFGLWLDYDLF